MEQKEMAEKAIEFLKNLDFSRVECMEIDSRRYEDRSTVAEISVTYYAQKEDKASERK